MRLERLDSDKIKIFLTFDDLNERGISKEDIWKDLPKVQQLFRDMILEADDELGFQADGPIEVEVFSLPAQGMVVIVSKAIDYEELEDDGDYIEMQVTLDESHQILYKFSDFDEVIFLTARLFPMSVKSGALYFYDHHYYLKFEEDQIDIDLETLVAILAEFGNTSTITSHRLHEYGKCIMEMNAIEQIHYYFVNKGASN